MIAVVFNTAGVNNTELSSPFTKPLYVAASVGFETPSFLERSFAVIVRPFLLTTNVLVTLAAG